MNFRFGISDFRWVANRRLSLRASSENPKSQIPNLKSPRSAVTLIELLITITIIAVLSAAFLGASRSAMELSRRTRTKATITKINTLLMERWQSYTTRRVDVKQSVLQQIEDDFKNGTITSIQRGQRIADSRLLALRELMKLEMPDRWSDVLLAQVPDSNPLSVTTQAAPSVLQSLPALSKAYFRRFRSAANKNNDGVIIRKKQSAECLYMIVMLATGDGEARTLFSQQDIGDTDGDGAPEFLDGWGRTIEWIRWPAGFVSDLQPVDPLTGNRLPDRDHDPFDPFRRDQLGSGGFPPYLNDADSAFRLVPLVLSRGPDGHTGILFDNGTSTGLDPYARAYGPDPDNDLQLGTTIDFSGNGKSWLDNIHNQLQENK